LAVAVCIHFILFQIVAAISLEGGLGGVFCSVRASQQRNDELPVPLPDDLDVRPVGQIDLQAAAWVAILVQAASNSLWTFPRLFWGIIGLAAAAAGAGVWWDIEARYCFIDGMPEMQRKPAELTLGIVLLVSWAAIFLLSLSAFARTLAMSLDDGFAGGSGL